jgi:60 kDa SS-A/Ro ribonucleoprotein
MSSIGLLTQGSDAQRLVVERLSDSTRLLKSRVHPMKVLEALKTYEQGHGVRGSNTWRAVPQVVDALDGAFYGSFKNVVPTNKRVLVAVDVSGSMSYPVSGFPMSCSQAAAAMALVTVATEPLAEVVAFDTSIRSVAISSRQRLDDVIRKLDAWGGGTDCVLPINYATTQGGRYDGIITYTDSENGGNRVHTRLDQYRARFNPSCKFVTAAMAANRFSLCRPNDSHSLDVVGLSADAPALIADFIDDRL